MYTWKEFPGMIFDVLAATTQHLVTGKSPSWKRVKIGDGTRTMALKVVALDGKHYTECYKMDLLNAADGLAETECDEVPAPQKERGRLTLCRTALEDGNQS